MQVHDVADLFLSVPVDKAKHVLVDTLNNDKKQLKEQTNLTFAGIYKLTGLCLTKGYILYENNLCLFENSGLIELSLMVVLSECYLHYLQKIKCKGIMKASNYKVAARKFRRFLNDRHASFQERSHADKFLEILNKQHTQIHKHSLNILDNKMTCRVKANTT